MTIENFIRFIRNKTAREHITAMAFQKNDTITSLKSIIYDRKLNRIYFNIDKTKENPYVKVNRISEFGRLTKAADGYQWSFRIVADGNKDIIDIDDIIKIHINMSDGYSPMCYNDHDIKNSKDVVKAIPDHLAKFKGKTVLIKHCTDTSTYTTFDEESDGTEMPLTDSYIISDFDYEIFYDNSVPDIPCIKMYDTANDKIFSCATGVNLITFSGIIFCEDGSFSIEEV